MEKVGRKGVRKDGKPLGKKVWDAIRGGEVEVAVGGARLGIKAPPPKEGVEIKAKIGGAELEARAPSVEEVKQLLDDGAEAVLKIVSQTRGILREAKVEELEARQIREKRIKSKRDCISLRRKAEVKGLPKEQKQLFHIFTSISFGDLMFHLRSFIKAEEAYRDAYNSAEKLRNKALQGICLHLIGAAVGMQEDPEKALPYFSEALKLIPDFPKAWYNKGAVLGELGQYREALACFNNALKLKPGFAEAWYNKGVMLCKLGQPKEALTCFDKMVKLKPDFTEAWYAKGEILQILGLESIMLGDIKRAEERAWELVKLKNEMEKDGIAQTIDEAMKELEERLSEKDLKSFKRFEEILRRFEAKKP